MCVVWNEIWTSVGAGGAKQEEKGVVHIVSKRIYIAKASARVGKDFGGKRVAHNVIRKPAGVVWELLCAF